MTLRSKLSDYSNSTNLYGIYRGVVEDRNDPRKLGRCKVRILGVHTELKIKTKTEGIPTNELPWAEPANGLFEGSISGFGIWSVPLQGSHVFVFFENGNILNPRYFATAPGLPVNKQFDAALDAAAKEGFKGYKKSTKDSAKKLHKRIKTNPNDIEFLNSNELGIVSKRWESGSRGSYSISTGNGDPGGVSYGSYQFASKRGAVTPFVNTLPSEVQQNFVGKTPGTPEYNKAWTQSVDQLGEEEFHKYEHAYIKKLYYDKAANSINNNLGVNANNRCAGVQDMIWSCSVQHGPAGAASLFRNAGVNDSMTDEEIINAVYTERSNLNRYFKSSGPSMKAGLQQRFQAEHKMILAKCKQTLPLEEQMPDELKNATEEELEKDTQMDEDKFIDDFKEDFQETFVPSHSDIGFSDPDGVYPLINKLNESDFHRLARGVTNRTVLDYRNQHVDGTEEPISNADDSTWKEPNCNWNPQYPDNIVIATHKGIVIELDNTDGAERLHFYHPSNSYFEITPDGDMIIRNNNNKYEIVISSRFVHIKSNENKTIDGNKQKFVKGNETDKISGNQDELVEQNVKRRIGIDYDDIIGQNETKKIGQNEKREIGSNFEEKIGSNRKLTIGGSEQIKVGGSVTKNVGGTITYKASTIYLN